MCFSVICSNQSNRLSISLSNEYPTTGITKAMGYGVYTQTCAHTYTGKMLKVVTGAALVINTAGFVSIALWNSFCKQNTVILHV